MKSKILLYLKGIAMGAADVVPGVSGGTIAFITGIYGELLETIKSFDVEAFKLLFQFKFKEFWTKINGSFLFLLLGGVGTSVVLFSRLILFLLQTQPILVWSFFFGLIIASSVLVSREVKKWDAQSFAALAIGLGTAVYITSIGTVAQEDSSLWYIFICGCVAITAMILPGISGSFILILMGAYQIVIGTLKNLIDHLVHLQFDKVAGELTLIGVFGLGCVIGIGAFSRLLTWLLNKYHDAFITLLTGFMLGSLNKVWPWKETITTFLDRHGVEKPLKQVNVLPNKYTELTGEPSLWLFAILLAIGGFLLVYLLDKWAGKQQEIA